MNSNRFKLFYVIFFSIFIIVGLSLSIFGFVKLAQYKFAKEIDATVISAEYNFDKNEINVMFEFELNGERLAANGHFTEIKYKDGQLPYYEGMQIKAHINSKNQIVVYGKAEIIVTVGGSLFFLFGSGFMYFFVLRRSALFAVAYEYEKSMILPQYLIDDTAKYEAESDELSKLSAYDTARMSGEAKIWKNRILDRLKSFTVAENVIYSLILAGLIVLFWTVFKLGIFGVFCGLLTFAFGGLLLKILYGAYIKILVKLGKFSEKKLATVIIGVFESEGSFQTGELSRNYIVFKKFRVVASIDGKRSVGYVIGNVPPPKGCVLKVLVRPRRFGRFIIDTD